MTKAEIIQTRDFYQDKVDGGKKAVGVADLRVQYMQKIFDMWPK